MASMNDKDYYEILGVEQSATTEEIRRAFQKKARTLHPDVNKEPDAEEKFKIVSEAYAVLSDEDKRRRYDAMRAGAPFMPSAGSASYGSPVSGGWPFGGFGYPFGHQAPNGQARAYNPQAGSDVVMSIELDAKSAKEGCKRGITYNHYTSCTACGGKGSVEVEESQTCPTCQGTGRITLNLEDLIGFGVVSMVCPECEGTGRVIKDPCHVCHGSGRTLTASEVVVDIPANSHDGDEIRIKGKGNAGTNGSSTGDFVVKVGVPAERLMPTQAMGFNLLGFVLPFLILSLLYKVFLGMVVVFIVPLAAGLVLTLRDGITNKNTTWWKNALRAMANGAANGVVLALFMFAFVSCSQSVGSGRVFGMWL